MGTIGNLAALVTKNERNTALFLLLLVILVKVPTMGLDYHWDAATFAKHAVFYSQQGPLALPEGKDYQSVRGEVFHPPLPVWITAVPFALFGESPLIANFVIAMFSFIGVFYAYKLGSRLYGRRTGLAAALLLLFSTSYFSLSGQFLYEVPLAALSTAAIYHSLFGSRKMYLAAAIALVLTKEPGIVTVLALSLYRLASRKGWKDAAFHLLPAAALVLWFLWSFINLGFGPSPRAFVNVELYQIPLRLAELLYISFFWKYLWILAIPLVLYFHRQGISPEEKSLLLVISGYIAFFAFLPVFLLPRYSLPVVPLFVVMGANALHRISKKRFNLAVGMLVILFISTYYFNGGIKGAIQEPIFSSGFYNLTSVDNGEMDLGYTDMVRMQTDALNYFFDNHPNSTVLAKFPICECALGSIDIGCRKWNAYGVRVIDPSKGPAQFALAESCCWSDQELDLVKNMSLEKSFAYGKYRLDIYSVHKQ